MHFIQSQIMEPDDEGVKGFSFLMDSSSLTTVSGCVLLWPFLLHRVGIISSLFCFSCLSLDMDIGLVLRQIFVSLQTSHVEI